MSDPCVKDGLLTNHIQILQKHEDEIKEQNERLEEHDGMFKALTENVKKIVDNINAMKWAVIGGVFVYFAKEIGLVEGVKILLGKIL